MSGYSIDIEKRTIGNDWFREVLYTGPNLQLVVMTLQVGEDIGDEIHADHDQFIRVESGTGEAILDGERHRLADGVAVVIPAGTRHNVVNTSETESLRLYTLHAPPEHPDGTLHRTKREAAEDERERDG
jgi:mannose-6-phosphate isomerase-like protein (cupin superfamily)